MTTPLRLTRSVQIAVVGLIATLSASLTQPRIARAQLIHRYSFKENADDSVGKINGKLEGKAKISGGKLAFENAGKASNDAALSYVSFSERILPKTGSATVEAWFTSNSDGQFARLFDFGRRGQGYLFLTVNDGGNDIARTAITNNDWADETKISSDGNVNDGRLHMVAVVIDGADKNLHFYVDGKPQGGAEPLGDNSLEKIQGANHWLGRSQYDDDAGFTGSISELRVFDTALKSAEIAAHFKAGKDEVEAGKK
jgi:hypothetical protein